MQESSTVTRNNTQYKSESGGYWPSAITNYSLSLVEILLWREQNSFKNNKRPNTKQKTNNQIIVIIMSSIDFSTGTRKELDGGATCDMVTVGGDNNKNNRVSCMRLSAPAGFSWSQHMKPHLPGNPTSCPHTHTGYCTKGKMVVTYEEDGTQVTIAAGDPYVILPGHDAICMEDTIMYEFSEQTKKAMEELMD